MNLLTELSNYLKKHDLKICTAESCTGGMIASCLTELPGSSEWFTMGFVTYTLEMKSKFLGVEKNTCCFLLVDLLLHDNIGYIKF